MWESSVPTPSASATAPLATTAIVVDAAPQIDIPAPDFGWGSPAMYARLDKEWNAIPKGKLNLHPAADSERDDAIKKRFGQRCHLERTCGPLFGIDCDAAVDGPYYYVRVKPLAFEEITTCGGACMGGRCTNCPPKNEGWTCPTY